MSSVYERAARCCLSGVSLWFDWINIVLIKTQSKVNNGNFMLTIRRTLHCLMVTWHLLLNKRRRNEMIRADMWTLWPVHRRAVCPLYTVPYTLYTCLLKRNVSSVSTLAVDTRDPWYSENQSNDGLTKTTQFVVISLLDERKITFLGHNIVDFINSRQKNNVPFLLLSSFHTPNSLKIILFGKVICGLLVSGEHFILKLNSCGRRMKARAELIWASQK